MWELQSANDSAFRGTRLELASTNPIALAKLPPFCKNHPELWFGRAEALFALHRIERDDTKFHTIVWHLNKDNAELVQDVILNPPKENKYKALKNGLISALSEQRLQKLMRQEGKKMPSVLLKQLMELVGPNFSEQYLRTYWRAQYPRELQVVIAAQGSAPWTVVGEKADKAWDLLLSERASAGRSLQESNRRARELNAAKEKETVCWYHETHRVYAFKCEKPCKYHEQFLKRFDPLPITLEGGWGSQVPSDTPWA